MSLADLPPEGSPAAQLALRARPAGRAAGYQRWSDLLFVHWRVPAAEIAAHLPAGLEADTFEGEAWLGLVPFQMSGVRPWWFPAVPGVSTFPETNVRTCVRCRGEPGVYFFSLEAAKALAVWIARRRWHLPYWLARMEIVRQATHRTYRSERVLGRTNNPHSARPSPVIVPGDAAREARPPFCHVEIEIGGELPLPQPGSLEFFLVERYLLFAASPRGLQRGQVHHVPYALRQARLMHLEETLTAATGFGPLPAPQHVVFSPGVDVEVFPLRMVSA